MTVEELKILRKEAADFLVSVQLIEGFEARRSELTPPEFVLKAKWPLRAIRRVLSWPEDPIAENRATTPPGTGLLDHREDGEIYEVARPAGADLRSRL